jgi:AraC-like DNA-binding protein
MDQNNVEQRHARPAVQRLQAVIAELHAALRYTVDDECAAQEWLSRATALLQTAGAPRPGPKLGGGLAPWQIRKLTVHIEANLDRPLRSCDLATLVRLSPAHFSRTFHASFGCPPLEYVMYLRIERAKRLMLVTDTPLGAIALDCGFADQAHFSRLFRRAVNETPRGWRRARACIESGVMPTRVPGLDQAATANGRIQAGRANCAVYEELTESRNQETAVSPERPPRSVTSRRYEASPSS